MKLSMETDAVRDLVGDMKAIEMIADAGFDCIDYSFYWTNESTYMLGDNYLEYAKMIRQLLDKKNLTCNQAHAPFGFKYGEEMNCTTKNYRDIVRSIEFASIIGAKCIVVHAIIPMDNNNNALYCGEKFEEENRAFYKSFECICKKYNIKIAVENLIGYDRKRKTFKGIFGTPKFLCDFIKSLDSEWFVACVDVGHAALVGLEPEDFIRGMDCTLLQALHIQDGDYLDDRHTLPYTGSYNWDNIIHALDEKKYAGDLTFELFGYMRKQEVDFLPQVLDFACKTGRYLISKSC